MMPNKLKSATLILALLLGNLLLVACGTQTTATNVSDVGTAVTLPASPAGQVNSSPGPLITTTTIPAKLGGTLKIGFNVEPDSLDPAKTASTGGFFIEYIYARLVHIGTDKLPHPWLAESWQVGDDSDYSPCLKAGASTG